MPDNLDVPVVDPLEIALKRLAELEARMDQVGELMAGWPTPPTLLQGFLAHRFQRRDGDGYQEPLFNIPEAPADSYYYGRHNYGWAQVVEEAPELTSRRSNAGWARASFGADTPWISLDDVLADYATVQFVIDSIAAIPAGIPDVPATNGSYARYRSGGSTDWITLTELGVAPLASPVFTGVPTAPTAGAGSNSDQLATSAWVQNQFSVRDYLSRSGGQMMGPLITAGGSGLTNPGLGIGDNATGFYRTGNVLVVSIGASMIMQWFGDAVMMTVPLTMANMRIQALADPTMGQDALNLRTADATYLKTAGGIMAGPLFLSLPPAVDNDATTKLYVDQRRAPPLVYDFPANVAVAGDSAWHQIALITFTIPRGGASQIMISVSCNVTDAPNLSLIGVRLLSGTPERRVFTYGGGPPDNIVSGFVANLTVNIAGPSVDIPIEVISYSLGSASPPFTVIGGGPLVATRSQIIITDLGPI